MMAFEMTLKGWEGKEHTLYCKQ